MLILSHIGSKIPTHVNFCLRQTRNFYDGDILFVTDNPDKNLFEKFNVEHYPVKYDNDKFKISQTVNFNSYPNRNFWLYSLSRFFFIEDLVSSMNIDNFIIYENDIMIYSDLKSISEKISNEYDNIAFTIGDDKRATTGFSYFSSYEDLIRLNNDIIEIINSPDDMKDIRDNYSTCCPSEMVFIRKISKEKNYIEPLPLFETDNKFSELGFVFDPASYGQYLGGTPKVNGSKKSYIDKDTYIGQELLKKNYEVIFENNKPYIVDSKKLKHRIFNLHIHSKKLDKFISE